MWHKIEMRHGECASLLDSATRLGCLLSHESAIRNMLNASEALHRADGQSSWVAKMK